MNVKKRLQKILDYVNDLEAENTFLDSKVAELEKDKTRLFFGGRWVLYEDAIEHNRIVEEENARLRDQLRWHSVDEKPPVSGKYLVKHFLRNQDGELRVAINVTYYTAHNNFWLIDVIKWCYIPDDNQGTDCTPEDGDA
jgi:hypothetical protein